MKKSLMLVGMMLVITFLASQAYSQGGPSLPYIIWGVVKDQNGTGLNGATVEIYKDQNMIASTTTYHDNTTGDGTYMIQITLSEYDIENGDTLVINASKEGYETTSVTITIDTTFPNMRQDLFLNVITTQEESKNKTPFPAWISIVALMGIAVLLRITRKDRQ